jgi:hypothetical protein
MFLILQRNLGSFMSDEDYWMTPQETTYFVWSFVLDQQINLNSPDELILLETL